MKVTETSIPGVLLVEPKVFGDARGFFLELHQQGRYAEHGIGAGGFVQDNFSSSSRGVLRGLHLQNPSPQGKLVSVLAGEVFDVAVDVRLGSPTFGRSVGLVLSAENHRQLWLAPGIAHGFLVLSEQASFWYKCTAPYQPSAEVVIRWDDPELGIEWPLEGPPSLSARDAHGVLLRDVPRERLVVSS